ncbi:hypothetical protein WR25_05159 [Diploscapter pachys]|uniref:Uncharacterized protein n=1 Tax=Diploscapter pachys TaxID=2018661 RepID=A0A2A2JZD4_9BILA|nr:hypothetical protein WR25_05159 [Diploscapter pachys]
MKQYFTGEHSILRHFFITRMDVFLIESVIDVLGALVGVALVRQAKAAINCVFPHRLAFQYAIPFVVVGLPLAIANIFPPITYFCVATGEYCYHDFLFILIVTLSLLGGIFAAALSLVVVLQLLEFFPTDCRLFGYLTYRSLLNIICRMFVPEFIASIQNWPNVHGNVAFAHLILFAVAALAQMANDVNRRMHCYYADIAGMNKVRKSARIPAAPVLTDEETLGTNLTNG